MNVHLVIYDGDGGISVEVYATRQRAEQVLATHRLGLLHRRGEGWLERVDAADRPRLRRVLQFPEGDVTNTRRAATINELWEEFDFGEMSEDYAHYDEQEVQA